MMMITIIIIMIIIIIIFKLHMAFIFFCRLCVVNFSIMQLTSDERMCFDASPVEKN